MQQEQYYHTTVLLNEAVEGLNIKESGVYVDCTFGGGGHSKLILEKLGPKGKLIVFDQDEDAWRNLPNDTRVIPIKENFRYLKNFLKLHGYSKVDGILADLGVSSWQFDVGIRGFSIRFDGPLDMRMDQRADLTAAQVINTYSEQQLHMIFEQYGEVRNAKQLAKHIVTNRNASQVHTTQDLKALLAPVVKGNLQKYLAQVFQALRIEVNQELEVLKELLNQSIESLNQEGRLCVITFHSLEDRLVKRFVKNGTFEIIEEDILGLAPKVESALKEINKKPIEPSMIEQKENSRSRSAKLRIAEKR
jgi:16S rRNA (cytosine1402-N4)-methyltransferase